MLVAVMEKVKVYIYKILSTCSLSTEASGCLNFEECGRKGQIIQCHHPLAAVQRSFINNPAHTTRNRAPTVYASCLFCLKTVQHVSK
jgi:hypothetical protein